MAKIDFKKMFSDSTDKLKTGMQKVQNSVREVDLKAAAGGVAAKGKEAADFLKQKTDKAVHAVKKKEEVHGLITAAGALKLMYMVVAADGKIEEEEVAQFRKIGEEFAMDSVEQQTEVIAECTALVKNLDTENYGEELNDAVRDVIQETLDVPEATIPVKLLLWDLLVIAQSDNRYQEGEERLIRYIARHLNVDKSIIPEMEQSLQAMVAVEKEVTWLKTTDRSFGVVEPIMNDLADRKTTIMQGIHNLIND